MARQGFATRNWTVETNNHAFTYSDYAKANAGITKSDVSGYVDNNAGYYTELVTNLFANYVKSFGDYKIDLLGGFSNTDDQQQSQFLSGNGLVVPDLFNVSNGVGTPELPVVNTKRVNKDYTQELQLDIKTSCFCMVLPVRTGYPF